MGCKTTGNDNGGAKAGWKGFKKEEEDNSRTRISKCIRWNCGGYATLRNSTTGCTSSSHQFPWNKFFFSVENCYLVSDAVN